jgi:hypothetical protein
VIGERRENRSYTVEDGWKDEREEEGVENGV